MKLVVLDIGGTSIKYAKYEDGILKNFSERSTDAKKGGAYVVQNAVEIIQSLKPFDGIGISTADRWILPAAVSVMQMKIYQDIPV